MYADVLVEINAKQVDQTFTYEVPSKFQKQIQVGNVVCVYFGKKEVEGYVLSLHKNKPEMEVKEILKIKNDIPVLNEELLELGKFVKENTLASLTSCYSLMLPKALKAKKGVNIKKKYIVYLKKTTKEITKVNKTQEKILSLFSNEELVLEKKAKEISVSSVNTLISNGILEEVKKEEFRYKLKEEEKEEEKTLTLEQSKALKEIRKYYDTKKTILLHGITGSGKTEVYIRAIEDIINKGKTALVLVPEISLTPQTISRFNKRFPNNIAVLHSHLSETERFDEYRKILNESVHIVIGARSAIFAPLKNIGIIILDEEHSDSYKQENNPKYHAIDIAKKRSETWKCPLILGSATPSLNTMARAIKKVYEYIPITKRATGALMPKVTLIDMNEEMKERHPILSRELETEIIKRLNKKEQIVLLLNRRGHSTIVTCSNCGFSYKCPYCEISLTYHKSSNTMRCHYCGYTKYVDKVCPKCNEDGLNYYGLGTEKLEEYLLDIFPTAKVLRMDRDSTTSKGSYEQMIEDFSKEKYDILLGTQMVSKGLDFPKVTLVGILNADASLEIPDYKSNERSFSLFCQASGRSGRNKGEGLVIIQTFNPLNPILTCVKNNDYKSYFKYEMRLRKTLKYPPFYFLAQVKLKGKDYDLLSKEVKKIKTFLNKNLEEEVILGPALSNPFYIKGMYQFEFLIKYKKKEKIIKVLKELDLFYIKDSKFWLDLDISY